MYVDKLVNDTTIEQHHSRRRAKHFLGGGGAGRICPNVQNTSKCIVCSQKNKKVFTKIFPLFFHWFSVISKKRFHFQVCPNIFKFAWICSRFSGITSKRGGHVTPAISAHLSGWCSCHSPTLMSSIKATCT